MSSGPEPAPPKTVALQPSFPGAARALWLLTWRNQLTWGRLPLMLLKLLILPALVFITTSTQEAWTHRHPWEADPTTEISRLARRLARAGMPLRPDQETRLRAIFAEEYARVALDLQAGSTAEAEDNSRAERIRTTFSRIRTRAKDVLELRQMPPFNAAQKISLDRALIRAAGPSWGRTGPFYHWLVDLYFFVVLPLWCVAVTGTLIREELQADTLGFLTTRPLSRVHLVLAKYLAQTAWLELILLPEAVLLFAAGALREVPGLARLLPLFLGVQFLGVLAWCAFGAFLGLATRRYLALAVIYGLVVEMGIGRIPTNINTLSLMRHLKALLATNPALQGVYAWPEQSLPLSLGALIAGTALFLALAALLFHFREYHHAVEMQK